MSKSRNWVFTLNNPTEAINPSAWIGVKTCIAALEIGDSGTLHYQGYLEWASARALSTCKALLPTAHWEARRGNRFQAINYVLKTIDTDLMAMETVRTTTDIFYREENPIVNWSTLPKIIYYGPDETYSGLTTQAEKSSTQLRLSEVQEAIKGGASDSDIAEKHFDLWVKYNVAFTKYRLMNSPPRDFKTKVIVITGGTGTGKSRWAMEMYPGAYWKPRSEWWDGYSGQDTVVLDEFYGWLPFDLLLRLCDRYPLNVQIKGGTTNFTAKTIIITSNKAAHQWYKNIYFESFIRRVEEWRFYTNEGQTISTEYSYSNTI